MKKQLLFAIFMLFAIVLFGKVVAKIGDFYITSYELAERMAQLPDTLKYKKRIAYSQLLNEKLFLNYAKENDISVTENELDDFFISQLGDDKSLQTNGEFDYDKFLKLKQSERGKKLLNLMKNDILIKKSKDLIIESFNITNEMLLDNFIMNSLNVDLDYAILNVDLLNFSENCNREGAKKFYDDNKELFKTKPSKIFRFSVRFFNNYVDSAKVITDKKINLIPDSLYSSHNELDSLKTKIFNKILDSLTYNAALQDYRLFRSSQEDSIKYFDTYPLNNEKSFDSFPKNFYKEMFLQDVLLPVKTDYGYVTIKYLQDNKPKYLPLEKVRFDVWKKYIKICNSNEEELRNYFLTHIDSFYISASLVEILKVPQNLRKISHIQEKFFSDEKTGYEDKFMRPIIFLNGYKNKNRLFDMIAQKINSAMEKGVIKDSQNYYIFKEILNFPEYLPKFEDIKDQLALKSDFELIDTLTIRQYYEKNKRNLVSPDSVKLGFAYFPVETDTITVTKEEVKNYYIKNRSEFKRKIPSLLLDFIALKDSTTAKKVKKYLDRGDSFDFLKKLYNEDKGFFKEREIYYNSMNDTLKRVVDNTPLKYFSEPFFYRNSWVIIFKKEFYNRRNKRFEEVKESIEKLLKSEKAKRIAFEKAKVVFDSTRYFSDCLKYVDKKNILKTEFQSFDKPFYLLGDMNPYKDELMRIWKNVKLTSIVQADSGFAVVFLLKKKYSKKLSYNEAKSKIIKILSEEKKLKNALEKAKVIRQQVINSQNPDSVVYFLGDWNEIKKLKLNSLLPGLNEKLSSLVLLDVSKHNTGYISPVLKLDTKHFLFYRVEKLKKVSGNEFKKKKNEILSKLIKEKMQEWLDDYKKTISIKFYGY